MVLHAEVGCRVGVKICGGRDDSHRHARLNPSSTCFGARGSAKVAVPTSMAEAPTSSSSAAVSPSVTPPTPTMGRSGKAACTSCTARTATGWIAAPETPPPFAPDPSR